MMEQNYSVLMSVYEKEKAEFLKQSIDSILGQTICPSDFVLVCDGPLTAELYEVIERVKKEHPGLFQIIRLPENRGLGEALKEGLLRCKNEFVARMDSDDVSVKNRCELQLAAMEKEQADVVGGWVEEFETEPTEPGKIRRVPEHGEEIAQYAKRRNPFNHPTVMFRREAVIKAGNYRPCRGFEDYHLWVRMLEAGCKGYNIPAVLVHMRGGNAMYRRRGGFGYLKDMAAFENFMRKSGYIGTLEFAAAVAKRGLVSLVPPGMRRFLYSVFLRK